ncbi:four helix bundle protein [Flavobacterium sp. NST-5]|uniref:Four helix bundle protein n=1 Tax=Flavobacterium ichthyis TaxID=2698827 RepID=A0ABW9Z596_9FLAO|nr:four helix bundle protein [Flavobacterium ichthyis]NBL63871.1 four helix bundle protein [Flavobacterium ichthyis]
MRNFKDLDIWKESRLLVKEIYSICETFPENEKFGLTSQIKRCVISIPSNIAEGSAKDSQKDFSRFLQISLGSCFELESHLILCLDLDLINQETAKKALENIQILQRRISAFIKYLSKLQTPFTPNLSP